MPRIGFPLIVNIFIGVWLHPPDRFEFNALRCAVEDLDSEEAVQRDYQWENKGPLTENDPAKAKNRLRRQTHINDYVERDFVEVCVDYAQSGVGGYDSWGVKAGRRQMPLERL